MSSEDVFTFAIMVQVTNTQTVVFMKSLKTTKYLKIPSFALEDVHSFLKNIRVNESSEKLGKYAAISCTHFVE